MCRTEVVEGKVPTELEDIVAQKRKELIGRWALYWQGVGLKVNWVICSEQLADVDDDLGEIFLSDCDPTQEDITVCDVEH